MPRLIINADDLGVCESTNLAVARAHAQGILNSASLMASAPAFEHALEHVIRPNPRLQIGLHLALTLGRSLLPPEQIPALVDKTGRFCLGFGGVWKKAALGGSEIRRQIEDELDAQFRRAIQAGVDLRHVDGHRHFHMIPPIFAIVAKLARKHGCPTIRLSVEPSPKLLTALRERGLTTILRNLPKQILLAHWARRNRPHLGDLATADQVFGIVDSGCMDEFALRRILQALPAGTTEIITHPGAGVRARFDDSIPAVDQTFLASPNRKTELDALLEPAVIATFRDAAGVSSESRDDPGMHSPASTRDAGASRPTPIH